MKILFVITGLSLGGAEKQLIDQSTRLIEKGHTVLICYLKGGIGIPNIPKEITLEHANFDNNNIQGFINLVRIINKYKPDVTHSHMVHANILTRLARIFTKIPLLICTAHSKNEGGWLRMRAYQLTDFLADITTNVSLEAVQEFIKLKATPDHKIISVYNGIDTEKFKPDLVKRRKFRTELNLDNFTIFLAVGRLVTAKDYPNMLKAFSLTKKKINNIKLIITGSGPDLENLKKITLDLEIENDVIFFGDYHYVQDLMNAADYFLLSSEWEGFGLVVAEAMASEKIVIATNAGGVSEVVGDCGYVVKPKDPLALSNAILQATSLSDKERKDLEKKARERIIRNFCINKINKIWCDLYGIDDNPESNSVLSLIDK